jgi:hypothetical protein
MPNSRKQMEVAISELSDGLFHHYHIFGFCRPNASLCSMIKRASISHRVIDDFLDGKESANGTGTAVLCNTSASSQIS